MTIRYAILTAVSTPEQAASDKISLSYQQAACRTAATSQGWVESAGPFVIDGYSRSSYVNLSDAERDILPLHTALESMRDGRYDVLVIYTYDRLGDLTTLISGEFRRYRRQLYSVSQPSTVQDPQTFNAYANESADIQQDVSRIVQRFRINDLRRKYQAGVPARLSKGLTPLRVPFGYRWVGKKEPPVLDEQQAALICQMRDWLFDGVSFNQIAARCNDSHISPPGGGDHWDITSIQYILSNPYYTGQVTLHKTRSIYDPSRKQKTRPISQPQDQWETGQGKHRPLWDEATHRAILRELERRRELNLRMAARYPLSGLLTCSVCGQKLHRANHSSGAGRRKVIACRNGTAHVIIPYDQAVGLVARKLYEAIKDQQTNPTPPSEDQVQKLQARLDSLSMRRQRVQTGYESDIYFC